MHVSRRLEGFHRKVCGGYEKNTRSGATDLCVLVTCPANAGGTGPTGCTCNSGFWGTIEAAAGGYSGSCSACTAVDYSQGAVTCSTVTNSQVEVCEDGYALTQSADENSADTCNLVACPANTGGSGPDSCTCNDGFHGTITAAGQSYSGTCTACTTVSNAEVSATYTCTSADNSQVSGCANGYTENNRNGAADLCVLVACPENTVGDGPGDCTCDNNDENKFGGFWGTITAKVDGYGGSCQECTPVANSQGAVTCTAVDDSKVSACKDGYALNGAGTACTTTLCEADHYVVVHTCQKCAEGWHQPAGDSTAGENTVCKENIPWLLIAVVLLSVFLAALAGVVVYLNSQKPAAKVTPDNL